MEAIYPSLHVREILEEKGDELSLTLLSGREGLKRKIETPDLNRPGLLLAGFEELFPYKRVQVVGAQEMRFLNSLSENERDEASARLFGKEPPAVIVAKGYEPPEPFKKYSEKYKVPLFVTPLKTTFLMRKLYTYLSFKLAPYMLIHGTLVDVYGVGILLTGKSGIGKSECAVDLVSRGHILVADDLVKLIHYPEGVLTGTSGAQNPSLRHFIEIRGVGIIDIYSLFGINSIRDTKKVEVHVELVEWSEALDYERVGLEESYSNFLGVKIPYMKLPINPGKNIAMIMEVIAMSYHLKEKGIRPAEAFEKLLLREMKKNEGKDSQN